MDTSLPNPTSETSTNGLPETGYNRERAQKFLLWLALVSICMLFAGLTSGYLVRRETGGWVHFDLPVQFWYGVAVILISSVTMNIALSAAKRSNFDFLPKALLATLALGLLFIVLQVFAWSALIHANIYAMGSKSSASGSYLYILSALHLAHVLGGLIALLVVYIKSLKKRYSSGNIAGIKLTATYWHFLTGLWVYLFVFMLLAR